MPIASMTGFARVAGSCADASWAWELRSVNGRGLDLRLRLPPGLDGVEIQARDTLSRKLTRGTVQANLVIDRPPRPMEIRINQEILSSLLQAAEMVRGKAGANVAPPTVDGLLAVRGVVEIIETPDSDEARAALAAVIIEGFASAVDALVAARQGEGHNIAAIVRQQVAAIERLIAQAETIVAALPAAMRERIREQVQALVENSGSLDADRLHQEAILLATRADVREELDRLNAHVAHAHKLLDEGGAIGRKFDFLAQEFNREANTLCSKSSSRELTEIGLSLKTVIDQLREQVQNIE